VCELIEAWGCKFLFLPTPPIFRLSRGLLEGQGAATEGRGSHAGALVEAMGRALGAVAPSDARGWFVHCGYMARDQSF
jgi:hypothetical protein